MVRFARVFLIYLKDKSRESRMDFQNRAGGKTGGGGVASFSDANVDRRERLRQLALETIDLQKDPYFMKVLLWFPSTVIFNY